MEHPLYRCDCIKGLDVIAPSETLLTSCVTGWPSTPLDAGSRLTGIVAGTAESTLNQKSVPLSKLMTLTPRSAPLPSVLTARDPCSPCRDAIVHCNITLTLLHRCEETSISRTALTVRLSLEDMNRTLILVSMTVRTPALAVAETTPLPRCAGIVARVTSGAKR